VTDLHADWLDATVEDAEPGLLFSLPHLWADMPAWHERVRQLREGEGVVRVDQPGYAPFTVLLRHFDVFEVSRHNALWANTSFSVLGPDVDMEQLLASGMPIPASLVQLDGHDHRVHRQVANDWFKPAVVGKRQPRIDELADQYVAKMRELGGECDFAKDIAAPFTLRVIMDIYGVPEEDEPLMLELTQGIFGSADPEFIGDAENAEARMMASIMNFIQYFNELTVDRQANPRDDLASVIANGQVDGCPMDDNHRLWYFIIVATAGHDTTSYALSGGMDALLRDPSQLRAIHDDPGLIGNAADEIIRWTSPVRHFLRFATEDTEVGGVPFAEGDRVLLSYPSANRDAAAFQDPMTFDVRRPDADKLLSFGLGAHFCLGSQFARREVRTLIGRLAEQLDHIEPAGEPSFAHSHFVSGVKHLPMRYSFR
jgi:cytochrome P450